MKTPITYYGGKQILTHEILELMPAHKIYVEPFFGGGALFFHLEPNNAIINDINTRLMDFYTAVQQNYPQLRDELSNLERIYTANRAAFEALKRQHPTERVEDANEALYYNLRDMYNGLVEAEYSGSTGFSVS